MGYALASFGNLGLIVVDKKGNRLWQYDHPDNRLYGLGIDPATKSIYYGTMNKIIEVTRLGNKVWEFSCPKLVDVHSMDVVRTGRVIVMSCTCTSYNNVVFIYNIYFMRRSFKR